MTQFNWNLNKMPKHPMPVPIATADTILGNRVAPAFVDWYLGKTGVNSQQTSHGAPRWGSNVFEPQDETHDRGARGSFSGRASERDPVSFVAMNRLATLAAAGSAVVASAVAIKRTLTS